ncbi:MAG TPA: chromosomal replication initiator protein DnaA, partial [Candidatus Acidoferrales bacterium]|nr:chromosomal replication initiator protein DnaA [Candidatus Acidoferrales bacterium]
MNIWDAIKSQISTKITTEAYQNWFSKTFYLKTDGPKLFVAVPDPQTKDFIQEEYGGAIWSAIREGNFGIHQIVYELSSTGNGAARLGDDKSEITFSPSINLNPKFSFDTFVVGSCNQFAHAAALAVATKPSRTYNPLFIYGGVGMGKTHLMHAIGRALIDQHAGMKIIYTSSERFMNEMIACIKNDRMQLFHKHYRSADVLLIDDIQILAGKERTQEEFFHTFNELFEHEKQIVISSDSPPKNTPGLVERLRSRFEWGLMVDVQPPDLETKMAILDKKAEAENIKLPEEVRVFIATKTKSNVRELEGALVKLIASSSVTGTPITLSMAQQTLKHLSSTPERRISMDSIIRAVAERFAL